MRNSQEYVAFRDDDFDNISEYIYLNQHEWKRKKARLQAVNIEWMLMFFVIQKEIREDKKK